MQGEYVCNASNSAGWLLSNTSRLDVYFLDPISFVDSDKVFYNGNPVTMKCLIPSARPAPIMTWLKGDAALEFGDNVVLGFDYIKLAQYYLLTLVKPKESDAGVYTCVARNPAGSVQLSLNLTSGRRCVLLTQGSGPGTPVITEHPAAALVISEGQNATMSCRASGSPAPTVSWMFKPGQSSAVEKVLEISGGALNLINVSRTMEGTFTCNASNKAGWALSRVSALGVNFLDSITYIDQSTSYKIGSTVLVKCLPPFARPVASMFWMKDREPVVADERVLFGYRTVGAVKYFVLVIARADELDAGLYTCLAVNDVGFALISLTLVPVSKVALPVFVTQPSSAEKIEGQNHTFSCLASSIPAPTYMWLFNGMPFVGDLTGVAHNGATLRLTNVSRSMQGEYVCNASNSAGWLLSKTSRLDVYYLDPIAVIDPDTVYAVGSRVKLACLPPNSNPTATMAWLKDGALLPVDKRLSSAKERVHQTEYFVLYIANATALDAGLYACLASGPAGSSRRTLTLVPENKLRAPEITLSPVSAVVRREGQNFAFTCNASGNPAPNYKWIFNGAATLSSRFSLEDGGRILRLSSLSRQMQGEYACMASNIAGSAISSTGRLDVFYIDPLIYIDPPLVFAAGNDATFKCLPPFSRPDSTMFWLRHGLLLPTDGRFVANYEFIQFTRFFVLTVKGAREEDAGDYTCLAINAAGSSMLVTKLISVRSELLPVITLQPAVTAVRREGQNYSLTCNASSVFDPSFDWTFSGELSPDELPRYTVSNNGRSLFVRNISRNMDGIYRCTVSNAYGSVASNGATLSVIFMDDLEYVDPNSTFVVGSSVLVRCSTAYSRPAAAMFWTKGGTLVTDGSRYTVGHRTFSSVRFFVLRIANSTASDAGVYMCLAINDAGSANRTVVITAENSAPLIIEPPSGEGFQNEGQLYQIPCRAIGHPSFEVKWIFNGMPLTGATVLENGALVLQAVTRKMRGEYRCNATNAAGWAISPTSFLDVKYIDSILNVDEKVYFAVGEDIRSRCLQPLSNPPAKMFWFKDGNILLESARVSLEYNVEGSFRYFVLEISNGLLPDAGKYWCAAVNEAGIVYGRSEFVTVPSKPTALTATPISGHESSQVRITWQPPRHLAGVLPERLKYLARIHRASNQVAALTVPFMTLEWVYADLDANVSYRISVQTVDEFRVGGGLSVLEYRTAVADTCSAGQFTCRPGACISRSLTCDGTANCADAADETTDAGCPLPSSISSLQQVNVGWNTIEVSWRPLPASNYLLFYVLSALATTSSQLYRLRASSTSHVITSLVDNTSYNVSIIGKNLAGFGPSTQIVVKTLELKRPSVPQGVTLQSPPGWEASRLRLLWLAPVDFGNALPSEISYELTVCEVSVSDKFLSCVVTGSVSSPHLVVSLNSNTTYEIIIAAVNSRRMYGSSYTIRHRTALKNKTPTAPTEVVINKNDLDESVTLTWNHPLDTAGTNRTQLTYRLRYCHASDAVNCAHVDLPTGVLNYTLRNLLPGSSYTVQIVALNFRNEEGSPITLIINTKSTSDVGLQGGEIAGIVLGCVVFVAIIVSALVIRKSGRGTLLTQPKAAEFSLAFRNPSVL